MRMRVGIAGSYVRSRARYPLVMLGHLLHIGFPKTGSKFLQRWFDAHPQLNHREGAIAGYGNVYEIVERAVAPPDGVLYHVTSSEGFTAPLRVPGSRIISYDEPSDLRRARENTCRSLAALFPAAHVLILTRGFRSMLVSSFSQYVRIGGDVPLEQVFTDPATEHAWDYDDVVRMYRNAFGADKLLVMPYELLRDDAERFLRTLEERLGLAHFAFPSDPVNTSLSSVEMYWYPRITRAVCRLPIGTRLKRMYLHGTSHNKFGRLIAMLQRIRPGVPITDDAIPEQVIAALRGKARTLCDDPLYAPYAHEYLA
jgi:hypothetical protein